jgi:hypothetical protein
MILPKAYIAHSIKHRVRIRFQSVRDPSKYFSKVKTGLQEFDRVHYIKINPITRSLVLAYDGNLETIKTYAKEHKLFDLDLTLKKDAIAEECLSKKVRNHLKHFDKDLTQASGGSLDLSSIAFTGLFAASIFQIYRGALFPPALSLLDTAVRTLINNNHYIYNNPISFWMSESDFS